MAWKPDSELALRYFRKAADLGSPEAQAYIGELLAPLDKAPQIARQMRQCATDQGLGDAASTLGIDLKTDKLYPEAVKAFQKGRGGWRQHVGLLSEERIQGATHGSVVLHGPSQRPRALTAV